MKMQEKLLETDDINRLADQVQEAIDVLMKNWFTSRENLDELVQELDQQLESQMYEKQLYDFPAFYLGRLEGSIHVIKELIVDEKRKKQVISVAADHGQKFSKILEQLAEAGYTGMRHGELAEAVGSSPNSLTNIMKKVIASGAVDVSRSGRNTHYVLSEAGRRYYNGSDSARGKGVEMEAVIKRLENLLEEMERQTQERTKQGTQKAIKPNDQFRAV